MNHITREVLEIVAVILAILSCLAFGLSVRFQRRHAIDPELGHSIWLMIVSVFLLSVALGILLTTSVVLYIHFP
jgi:hypothetical protein